MNTHNNRDPKNKLAVYKRQSQKGRAKIKPQEIKEANLFVLARRLGFEEGNIVVF